MVIGIWFVGVCIGQVCAEERLYDEGVPEHGEMTIRSGDYELILNAETAWTIKQIRFGDALIGGPTGFYGTVLIPKGGQWIGTGHTEGGREIVHSLKLTVDGEERPVEVGATVEGARIELVKTSTIHKFATTWTITLTANEIVERAQLRATEDHELKRLYAFMHCWTRETTTWAAELADGEVATGELDHEGGNQVDAVARWVAEYWPEEGLGILGYMPRFVTGPGARSFIWEQDRYHKFYVQQTDGAAISEGDELDFTIIVKAVPGETGDWAATKAAAAELAERYPPEDD